MHPLKNKSQHHGSYRNRKQQVLFLPETLCNFHHVFQARYALFFNFECVLYMHVVDRQNLELVNKRIHASIKKQIATSWIIPWIIP